MIFGVPINEVAWLLAGVLGGGVVTGLMAGLFGIGGGAVIVPVLFEVFRVLGVPDEVRMQLCVGTSLAIIVPTNIRSYMTHRDKGAVDHPLVKRWVLPALAGIAIGSVVAAFAPPAVFRLAFVVIALAIAFKLLFGRDSWRLGDDFPGQPLTSAFGLLVGLSSSLMGVSGGSVANMIQTLYGRTIHQAVATSAALGVPISIAGTVGYIFAGLPHRALLPPLSLGFVSLIGLIIMAPVSTLVAPYGARLAHALPRRQLEIGFAIFLLVASARFVATLV
ncbi:MAG TPA: sulfite exporter TauE/SafE family protein [Xanthobacteraceae bacterium]|nr:sulfite exporter TauE/SafE family protein [Xanthobacteraceae bacterium]